MYWNTRSLSWTQWVEPDAFGDPNCPGMRWSWEEGEPLTPKSHRLSECSRGKRVETPEMLRKDPVRSPEEPWQRLCGMGLDCRGMKPSGTSLGSSTSCLSPRAPTSLCDVNLPSTYLVPAAGEYSDVTPLWCHSTEDSVFRCVYLHMIKKCLFQPITQPCLEGEGFNLPLWLCHGWNDEIVAVWRQWWNSHLPEVKAKVHFVPFKWAVFFGNFSPGWAKPSGLQEHHPDLQGFTPFYKVFRLIEWHNTKPIMFKHQDFE